MTAAQIAKVLGIKEVVVNYKASDLLTASAETNPLERLEFIKHKGDFNSMRRDAMY